MKEIQSYRKTILITGLIGIIAALLGATGDILLLYVPGADYFAGDYAFLKEIPNDRLAWGHYLGILFIPIQLAGLVPVYLAFRMVAPKGAIAMVVLGIYLCYPGIAYHGSLASLGAFAKIQGSLDPWLFKTLADPLAAVFVTGFLFLSLGFVVIVIREQTLFPKWAAALNPAAFYGLILGLYMAFPGLGEPLLVAGFNLALALFYAFVLGILLQRRGYQEVEKNT